MGRPSARHSPHETPPALVPLPRDDEAESAPSRGAFDAPANVTTSRAARTFAGATLLTAVLAIASAALFHRAAGASVSLLIAAANCLLAAVLVQVIARRWMREELMAEGIRQGLDEAVARERARLAVARWIRKPREGLHD